MCKALYETRRLILSHAPQDVKIPIHRCFQMYIGQVRPNVATTELKVQLLSFILILSPIHTIIYVPA